MFEKKLMCNYCNQKTSIKNFLPIYRLLVNTKDKKSFFKMGIRTYKYGLTKFFSDLGAYAMKKGYHLSSSQIVLLRTDILKEFLTERYNPETVVDWGFEVERVCTGCYEKYKELVPSK